MMTLISYAQNFEDVMLARALQDVETGFYVDVGAWSPVDDSVTKLFYDRGWSGINIEPNKKFYEQFLEQRPVDINLNVAVSDRPGSGEMYFFENSGLSTLSGDIAERHRDKEVLDGEAQVSISTMTDILSKWLPRQQPIHFLKVDVEGLEAQVLSGNDWDQFRPWIVVVEATLPLAQIQTHSEWEELMLSNGYSFCYFDGLNRFYLAKEAESLRERFQSPPNFFDDFINYRHYKALRENENLRYESTRKDVALKELQDEIDRVYQSRSWRITSPFRKLNKILKS